MRRAQYDRSHLQRGVAAIEFLIGVPVLLMIAFAIAEIGQLLTHYNTLTKSVRDGARYAIVNASVGSTRVVSLTTQTRDNTRNLVVKGNISGSGSAVLPGFTTSSVNVTDAGGGYISVTATYTYSPIVASTLPTFGFGGSVNLALPLNATVVMRAL